MKDTLDVGDTVLWRGRWGQDNPLPAVVKGISVGSNKETASDCQSSEVASIEWAHVNSRDVIVDLDNGHWAYGNQINQLEPQRGKRCQRPHKLQTSLTFSC